MVTLLLPILTKKRCGGPSSISVVGRGINLFNRTMSSDSAYHPPPPPLLYPRQLDRRLPDGSGHYMQWNFLDRDHRWYYSSNAKVDDDNEEDDIIDSFRGTSEKSLLEQKWKEQYENIVEFKRIHGHCVVPIMEEDSSSKENTLGKWVHTQRYLYSKKQIRQDRYELLEKIGFVWDAHEESWSSRYKDLQDFYKEHGHTIVPRSYPINNLGHWVAKQRHLQAIGELKENRFDLLNELDFVWGARQHTWQDRYEQLLAYKEKHGHCTVPQHHPSGLGYWVKLQRENYTKYDRLPEDRYQLLENIGFSWDPQEESWMDQYQKLVEFKNKHGHCNAQRHKDGSLGVWVGNQRVAYANQDLRQDRSDLLQEIGFIFDLHDASWMEQYGQLTEFRNKNGHCNVPQDYGQLGFWVRNQRAFLKKNELKQERYELLQQIDFIWNVPEYVWQNHFEKLVAYKIQNGHCNVPYSFGDGLGGWLYNQRRLYESGKMSEERMHKLEAIGFHWQISNDRRHATSRKQISTGDRQPNKFDQQWLERFEGLQQFHNEHGHWNIRQTIAKGGDDDTSPLLSLHGWVTRQRYMKRRKSLREDRQKLLEEIGFEW